VPSLPGETLHENADETLEGRIAGDTARGGRLQDGRPDVRHAQSAVLFTVFIAIVFALVVAIFTLVLAVLLGKRQPGFVVTAVGREREPEFAPGKSLPSTGPAERLVGGESAQHGRWAARRWGAGCPAGRR
jgi:hypothetical protein